MKERDKLIKLESYDFEYMLSTGEMCVKESEYDFALGDCVIVKEIRNGRLTGRSCKVHIFFELKKHYCPKNYRIVKVVEL